MVLLPLQPAVTYVGVLKMLQPGLCRGLLFSSRDKCVMSIKPAALELLSHVKFKSQLMQLPFHELQVSVCSTRCAVGRWWVTLVQA